MIDRQLSNLRDEYGQSPLHKASMNGWIQCVELLLEFNSNINAVDVAGMKIVAHIMFKITSLNRAIKSFSITEFWCILKKCWRY